MNFFRKYWRGDISLPVSYWLVSLGVTIAALVLAASFRAFFQSRPDFDPQLLFFGYVTLICSVSALAIWQTVGLIASAKNYIRTPNKRKIWGRLAILMAVIGVINSAVAYKNDVVPSTIELFEMAFSDDPGIPPYNVTVIEGGTELKIEGGLKFGLVNEVKKALAHTPSIKIINLDSVGGRIGVATELYAHLSQLNLDTVTNGSCLSACIYVFAAGKNRWLGINGRLGFHAVSFAKKEQRGATADLDAKVSSERKISRDFLTKAAQTPASDMWYPGRDELLRNNFITSLASKAVSSRKQMESALADAAAEMKASLPQKVDEATTLMNITAVDMNYSYLYAVAPSAADQLLNSVVRAVLEQQVSEALCTTEASRNLLNMGVGYIYVYEHAMTKKRLASFAVTGCHG